MADFDPSLQIPVPEKLTLRENLELRRHHIGKSCRIHYASVPLKIVRAHMQYMYDDFNNEFLDCINNSAHVGHCQSNVVKAGQQQMATLITSPGFVDDNLTLYAKRLTENLPDKLCVCFFVNSGSEANDLAIKLARAHTKHKDIVVLDKTFHGNLTTLTDVSPHVLKKYNLPQKSYVHMVPCPSLYRGKYQQYAEEDASQKYVEDAVKVIKQARNNDRKIAAFLSEPVSYQAGVVVPPTGYLRLVYQAVRDVGGVCIADEVQTGLGRTGYYWAFMSQDVVPDIITCGKPLGNGFPLAVVITTEEIAASLQFFKSSLSGSPLACAIGLAVLDSLETEQMVCSAKCVGRFLIDKFTEIMPRHPMIGDVRGLGLIVGVEIVTDKESRKPAKDAAELLCYKLKQAKILIANEGPDRNVLILTPPMCFTIDNARLVVEAIDKYLTEIEQGTCPELLSQARGGTAVGVVTTPLHVPDYVTGGNGTSSDDEDDDAMDGPSIKRPRRKSIEELD